VRREPPLLAEVPEVGVNLAAIQHRSWTASLRRRFRCGASAPG
jgi:hypothetical protein